MLKLLNKPYLRLISDLESEIQDHNTKVIEKSFWAKLGRAAASNYSTACTMADQLGKIHRRGETNFSNSFRCISASRSPMNIK